MRGKGIGVSLRRWSHGRSASAVTFAFRIREFPFRQLYRKDRAGLLVENGTTEIARAGLVSGKAFASLVYLPVFAERIQVRFQRRQTLRR